MTSQRSKSLNLLDRLEELDTGPTLEQADLVAETVHCLGLLRRVAKRGGVTEIEAFLSMPEESQDTLSDLLNDCDWTSRDALTLPTALHVNAVAMRDLVNLELQLSDEAA